MSKLHFTVQGEGEPLVLVHGLGASSRWWRRNTKALAEHFKVYLVDLPGFGLSGSPCALAEIAQSLELWLDHAELDCVNLVGHSMGGYVSIHLAAMRPERVRRLALINSAGIPVGVGLREMTTRLMLAFRHGSPTFIPTVITDVMRAGLPSLVRLSIELLQIDARPLCQKIQIPTLVLWGIRDKLLPPELGLQMAECLPNATFQYIPRAGHNPMVDRPAVVNRYLLDYLLRDLTPRQSDVAAAD
jgi:pimeloyl-ACP methyl ester carboxylesterase